MPRLSIDITPEQHRKLKAIAALKGQSIKEFVLGATLNEAPPSESKEDIEVSDALRELLKERMDQTARLRDRL